MDYRISVFETDKNLYKMKPIARVRYNAILDYWNGMAWQNGGIGLHKGLTVLKDGRYVLIEGSDFVNDKDIAFIISKDEALRQILKSGNVDLLKMKKFKELNDLYIAEENDLIDYEIN